MGLSTAAAIEAMLRRELARALRRDAEAAQPTSEGVEPKLTEIPKRVEKPWGYELWWARTDRYVGKILHVKRGESLSLQYHNVKDETIMIQSGRLLFETRPTGEEGELRKVEMGPGDVFHITPGTLHRMTGLEDCDIVEVSTPELDDVVRLEDRYGRAGTSQP